MRRSIARTILQGAVHTLGLAGVLGLALCLPAIWLTWEASSAQTQAELLAGAAATRAEAGLVTLFARFERATASLRAQDLQGDTVSLTGRLLRAEPLVAPAIGLVVINNRGSQLASSTVEPAPIAAPVWWYRAQPIAPAHRAAVLGCGATPPDGSTWMLARDIEGAQDVIAGQAGSAVPDAVLRAAVTPINTAVDYSLRDSDGCELLHRTAKDTAQFSSSPQLPSSGLIRLYRAVLPAEWLTPAATIVTIKVANLTWTGTVTPAAALGLRASDIDRHAGIVLVLLIAFGGVALLLLVPPALGPGRPRTVSPAPASRPAEEHEMAELRHALSAVAGERDRVLTAIGHDVRTPMNSILGICALLLDGDLDEAQRKWLRRIRASCEALLAMLNGMLEIAAARVDGAEVHLEAVDIASLVEEVGDVLRPQAEDKGLDLLVAIEDSALGVWNTDPTRLRQVLFNLGGNAIKYTAQGFVEIRALMETGADGRDHLRLQVTDTGPGVAEEEREAIFEQFRRGRDEVSLGQEGLGLGLALCREIAVLLGGTLSLGSPEDGGSIFTFEVPIERGQASLSRGGLLAGRTALVVGLSEGMRRRVASHLESIGCDVETAGDGFIAIGLAERMAFQHGTLDLVVVDATLAGLSADALLQRLGASRSLERPRTVLVGNGPEAIVALSHADAAVSHPVEARELDQVVAVLFGDRSPLQQIDRRAPAAPASRILVVEDNRINQALFVDQLNRAGFSTFAASDGKEAVDAARRGGFDAILMDVQMPEIDGVEATRRIRAAEQSRHVPIIGMTAHTGPAVRKRCLEAGMNLVLHKPVDFAGLPARLREVIAAARLEDGDDTRIGENRPAGSSLDIDDTYLEVLLAEVGVKRARICVTTFIADMALHLEAMDRHVITGGWDELGFLAHGLAGIAGTLGAISLADGLLMLEDATRIEGQPHVDAALQEVRSTWDQTGATLRSRFEAVAARRGGGAGKKVA